MKDDTKRPSKKGLNKALSRLSNRMLLEFYRQLSHSKRIEEGLERKNRHEIYICAYMLFHLSVIAIAFVANLQWMTVEFPLVPAIDMAINIISPSLAVYLICMYRSDQTLAGAIKGRYRRWVFTRHITFVRTEVRLRKLKLESRL